MAITIDLDGSVVLITGGTKGIGLATGLEFGRAGATAVLTHKWGTADEGGIRKQFDEVGARPPLILCADVKEDEDTKATLDAIAKAGHEGVDFFVSNVGFSLVTKSLDDYKKKSFFQSLEYSVWPMIAYTQAMKKVFGRYPKHVIGVSSDGPDSFYPGYDFVAYGKALMETMCRYLAVHLQPHGVQVNVLRSRMVITESLQATFGDAYIAWVKEVGGEAAFIEPQQCGEAMVAMCSGLMSALSGQVVSLDNGLRYKDSMMNLKAALDEQSSG